MSDVVIEIEGLAKSFRVGAFHQKRVQAVSSVDLTVNRGEVFGFVGPNGAGKTTVIKMLVGLLRPSAGSARVLGRRLPNRDVQRRIGYLPETPHFYEYLTGVELLDFYGELLGMARDLRRKRAAELLRRVGLEGRADRPMRKYSKGMVQRLGLAQALLNSPDFLLLDEPMSGLDPVGRRDIREIILEERRAGRTVFFSSHILSDVEELCDRVGFLVEGRMRSIGTVEEIRSARVLALEVRVERWAEDTLGPEHRSGLREARTHGAGATLVFAPHAKLDGVLQRLAERGAGVLEVKQHRQSLEDYFMTEAGR